MNNEATALSAEIVSYCKERSLSLDGMALDLENGAPLDADMCDAISAYCATKSLTLGGLLPKVEALFAAYVLEDERSLVSGRGLNTHQLKAGDILRHFGADLLLVERREHFDKDQPENPTVTFSTECLHLEKGATMPHHWAYRDGGYTIQGNRYATWNVIRLA